MNYNATVTHNKERNGVQIKFDSKPSQDVLNELKANRFHWSKYNKVWYNTVSPKNVQYAAKFGSLPSSLSGNTNNGDNAMAGYINAQEEAMCDNRMNGKW